jgi:hypothetical protein
MTRRWTGDGPTFGLDWGGRAWALSVDGARPGLTADGLGPILGLDGVSEVGRRAPGALSGASLVGWECRLGRVEATYAPPDWGSLFVRAAWSPSGDEGVDLEIQIHALTVGQLHALEVNLLSDPGGPGTSSPDAPRTVESRDARCAGLSYDGREPDLHAWTTLPPGLSSFSPRVFRVPEIADRVYVEMVHPDDIARRISSDRGVPGRPGPVRYGLFGYDLEKGVVLRARLRGLWLRSEDEAPAGYERFLREPPPLMT